ncbi:hypothetical protein GGR51DRAFT_531860 [Nemania sp. FL0031]|nr:hypothetical protein GGR51DRAFT_531860 [Nemania sp. FL0031]
MPPLPPPSNVARDSLRRFIPRFETPGALRPRTLVGAITVPQGYGNAPFGPDSGTVAGIVLGSVAGFLLFLALIYWCVSIGQGPRMREEGSVVGPTSSVISWTSRPRGPPRKHARRSKRASRREKVEIRRERVVPVRVEHGDQIIVEEFQSGSHSRPRSVSRSPPRRPRGDDDDRIIVEEEPPSPRRRRDSMRSHRRGSIREDVYMRDVSRQRSRSRA